MSGNAHQRRVELRSMLRPYRLAVWSPIGLAIGAPADAILHARESVVPKAVADKMRDSLQDEASNLRDFFFIPGSSVRNTRTKSVATMLERGNNQILVKRRDNRSVYWPLEECENWNV